MDRTAGDIRILDECTAALNELVFERKWQYIIYQVTDDYTLSVEEKWGKGKTHDDLVGKLKEVEIQGQCRFVVLDVMIKKEDIVHGVCVLLLWVPDSAHIRQKITYTANVDLLRRTLGSSVRVLVSCTKDSDLAISNIQAQVS